MKNLINNRWYILWIVPIMAMFFSTGTVNAQNPAQNKQQVINKAQSFLVVDTNKDGFISKEEYKLGSLDAFDTDKDGKLSRNEYRSANRSLNGNTVANARSGKNGNKANCKGAQKGNGVCKNGNQGNGQNKGTGVCPKGNKGLKNNSGT